MNLKISMVAILLLTSNTAIAETCHFWDAEKQKTVYYTCKIPNNNHWSLSRKMTPYVPDNLLGEAYRQGYKAGYETGTWFKNFLNW